MFADVRATNCSTAYIRTKEMQMMTRSAEVTKEDVSPATFTSKPSKQVARDDKPEDDDGFSRLDDLWFEKGERS